MVLTILADDLTGACDTGTLFAAKASVPVSVWPDAPRPGSVRVIDTESRSLSPVAARERIAHAARSSDRWFKKIDSTLRGSIGAELDALMAAVGAASAIMCPALPSQGRIVRDRVLLIDGVPIVETAVAHDPNFPTSDAPTSSVVDILRRQIDRPIAWIPIEQVRSGAAPLAARIGRLTGTVAVADAETDDDLDALVDAALAADPAPLLVGAAGLARALASHLGLLAERVPLPRAERWLVVAGSRHPVSRGQAQRARAAGLTVVTSPDADEPDRHAVAARLADDARRLVERDRFDIVAVTGGDTAVALYRALAAEQIDLVGAPMPGLALGSFRSPRHDGMRVITKAGGFGAPDLFVTLARQAAA
jgi:uncharacterized protein YgbK (DUF1537 family)